MMQTNMQFVSPWRLAGLPKESPVLLAFSGGADSTALLHLLWENSQADGYPLFLAHVNHGIRGEEALRDRAFCAQMAERYGLEIFFADVDIPALAAKNRRSLEEEAREVRYEFFASLMKEHSIPLLATAHHADDNLETLLFRLARGTTLHGLCGISPARAFGDEGVLVRPLLQVTRAEILDYCAQNQLDYMTDSTNADLFYARNKLRGKAVPVLEELFSSPQHRVTALCEELRLDEDFLSGSAKCFLEQWKEKGCLIRQLKEAHPAIQSRVLAAYVKEQTGYRLEQLHLRELLQMTELGQNGARRDLPFGWIAVIEQDRLRVMLASQTRAQPFSIPFSWGRVRLQDSDIVIRVEKSRENTKIHNLSIASYIISNDFSAIMNGTLYWRTRVEGDTLVMGGMTRKLRKLYNQNKIPLRLREQMPLLCDENGVLWAPFVGARDGVPSAKEGILIAVELPCDSI